MKYELDFDYDVVETTDGIDVYDKSGNFLCELGGQSLADYSHDGKVDDYALTKDIDFAIAVEELMTDNFANVWY